MSLQLRKSNVRFIGAVQFTQSLFFTKSVLQKNCYNFLQHTLIHYNLHSLQIGKKQCNALSNFSQNFIANKKFLHPPIFTLMTRTLLNFLLSANLRWDIKSTKFLELENRQVKKLKWISIFSLLNVTCSKQSCHFLMCHYQTRLFSRRISPTQSM